MLNMNLPSTTSGNDDAAARRRSRRVTQVQLALLGAGAVLLGFFAMTLMKQPARAQGRPVLPGPGPARSGFARRQGFGPGPMQEVKLVHQFDKNGDSRLDVAERKAAREWLTTQGVGQRRGGFGGSRFAPAAPGRRLSPQDVRAYPDAPVYDPMTLRTVFLQFESTDWEPELAALYNTDVEIPAAVTVDGRVYKDVGVHFRGNSSFRMVPEGSKRSLSLSFDFVHPDQQLGGYRSFNFLNGNGDPTFLRTMLYSEIGRHYLPIAKVNFVRVVINGESWGLYVNEEQINKDFLRGAFGTTKGARWKVPGSPRGRGGLGYLGDDVALYKQLYEIKTTEDPKAWADLVRLCRVLSETPTEELEAALKPILDVDGALKFLALEVVLDNGDGYWTRASDYAIYEEPSGRFHILPYDFNEAFAAEEGRGFGGGRGGPELDPLVAVTDSGKPLRSRLLAVPALRARYLSLVRDMAEHWLDWKTLGPTVSKYRALIADDVKADSGKLYSFEAFQSGFGDDVDTPAGNTLKGFAARRRAFLLR